MGFIRYTFAFIEHPGRTCTVGATSITNAWSELARAVSPSPTYAWKLVETGPPCSPPTKRYHFERSDRLPGSANCLIITAENEEQAWQKLKLAINATNGPHAYKPGQWTLLYAAPEAPEAPSHKLAVQIVKHGPPPRPYSIYLRQDLGQVGALRVLIGHATSWTQAIAAIDGLRQVAVVTID